jgi:hypothetical protein
MSDDQDFDEFNEIVGTAGNALGRLLNTEITGKIQPKHVYDKAKRMYMIKPNGPAGSGGRSYK